MSDSEFRSKAGAAGAAIGDMAEAGLKTAQATATATAGAAATIAAELFGKAKGLFGGDDDAKMALQKLVAAQDDLTTAISLGDEKAISAAKSSLTDAWSLARKVAAED